MIRLFIQVDDDVPALLSKLAGGKQRRGQWLAGVLRQMDMADGATSLHALMIQMTSLRADIDKLRERVEELEKR